MLENKLHWSMFLEFSSFHSTYVPLLELEFGLMLVVIQSTLHSLLVQWTSREWSIGWKVTSIELNSKTKKMR